VGFFAPWFLAGLAAVGLPVWLHLLRRSQNISQPFSSLMFFERRTQSTVQPRRLRYLALLLLRIAVLTLLALAFAKPFINEQVLTAARKTLAVIAVDRSFSMRHAGRMERAKNEARQVLAQIPANTPVQVFAIDARTESLTQAGADRQPARAAIDTLRANDQASSFGQFARSVRALEQSTGNALEIHFISDMQATSMPPAFADLQLDEHTSLTLHSVAEKEAPNWAVETVNAAPRVYDPKHTRAVATIAGWQTPQASRRASLVIDGNVVESKDVVISSGGRAQVEFLSFNVPYGAHHGEIRMEPHDALPEDDSFPFPLERSDPRNILFLGNGRPREIYYFKTAIESASQIGLNVQAVPIQATGGEELSKYAFVVMADIGKLDSAVERQLTEYLHRGGSLLVLAGPRAALAGRVPILGWKAERVIETQGAGFLDASHPALRNFGSLPNVQFFESTRFTPAADARILMKLTDGSPLLTETRVGEGRVLIFASTFDNLTSDFPLHQLFLPFVAQLANYLGGEDTSDFSIATGTPLELRQSARGGTAVDVIGPDGHHRLSLSQAAAASSFEPSETGFYEIHRANGQRALVAAHTDRRESDLTTASPEALEIWRHTGRSEQSATTGGQTKLEQPRNLWRLAMVLVLLFALAESIFASRYLKEERQAI
jgi:hypothetical protein